MNGLSRFLAAEGLVEDDAALAPFLDPGARLSPSSVNR
jgi:hypothetical protein